MSWDSDPHWILNPTGAPSDSEPLAPPLCALVFPFLLCQNKRVLSALGWCRESECDGAGLPGDGGVETAGEEVAWKTVTPKGETHRRVTPSTGRGGVGGLALCPRVLTVAQDHRGA